MSRFGSVSPQEREILNYLKYDSMTTVMSSVCVLRPVFAFCVLRYVRHQNARHPPKCLEMLGTMLGAGWENAIGRGRKHTVY